MRRNAGLSVIEILIIIVCICAVTLFFAIGMRHGGRTPAYRTRCTSNLKCLGTAMHLYRNKFGDMSYFAEPANAFRGDCFLAILYWKNIAQEPKLFVCPATTDVGDIPPLPPFDWTDPDAIRDDTISYAGRCKGLTGAFAHRNTNHTFTEAAMSSASAMACDKAHNHAGGVNVVYFDSHAAFIPDAGPDVGVMHPTGAEPQLRYMDSGER